MRRGRVARGIKSAHSPAVLAFSAAVGKAGSALFPLLQTQAARTMAALASARSSAMRAFPVIFNHLSESSFPAKQRIRFGIGDKGKNCGLPGAGGEFWICSACTNPLPFDKPPGISDFLPDCRQNP